MTTFNEFQKELQKRNITQNAAYMFSLVYERLIETERQLTVAVRLIEEIATAMQGFVELNEKTQKEIVRLKRGNMPDGVEVKSVANDTEH